ncbi:MAG: YraN family protein [Bacteroidota bacterium]
MAAHNDLGKKGEEIATGFLEAKGYNILDRNYRYEKGEIDIVALRLTPAEVVFVEVKTRATFSKANPPEAAVSPEKQKKLFKVADSYLYEKQLTSVPSRFDIIAISMDNPEHPMIHHIEDAFRMFGGF